MFSEGFKANALRRLVGPDAIPATRLAIELGVWRSTLSRWLRAARTVPAMGGSDNVTRGGKSPREWSPEEKLGVVVESLGLSEEQLGEFLRRKGLHRAQLDEWRTLARQALAESAKGHGPRKPTAEDKRIRALEKELQRKDKALAEVTALLVLKKKLEEIWGDEDESTPPRSAR